MHKIFLLLPLFILTSCFYNEPIPIPENERNEIIKKIEDGVIKFKDLDDNTKSDTKIAKVAIKKDKLNIWSLDDKLMKDKEFVLDIPKSIDDINNIPLVPIEFLKDSDFITNLVKKNTSMANAIPPSFLSDPVFIKNIATSGKAINLFESISASLQNNKGFILELIALSGTGNLDNIYVNISPDLENDKELALAIIKKNPNAYKFASSQIQNDKEVATLAIQINPNIFPYLPIKLRTDKDLIEIASKGGYKSHSEIKKKEEIIKDIDLFEYASQEIRTDKALFLELLAMDDNYYFEDMILYADESLRSDNDFAIKAVEINGRTLQSFSTKIRSNKDIVTQAVKNNSVAFGYASSVLKSDKDFVISLITENNIGSIFEYLDPSLRSNKEVALIGAEYDPTSIFYMDVDLRSDAEILVTFSNNFPYSNSSIPFMWQLLVYDKDKVCTKEIISKQYTKINVCNEFFQKLEKTGERSVLGGWAVLGAWYDEGNKYLIVQINDANRHYCGFTISDWESFKEAKDPDSYFGVNINQKYDCSNWVIPRH